MWIKRPALDPDRLRRTMCEHTSPWARTSRSWWSLASSGRGRSANTSGLWPWSSRRLERR